MKIKNLTSSTMFCGYGEPAFQLAAGAESATLADDYACTPSPRTVISTPAPLTGAVASVANYATTVPGTVKITAGAPHGLVTGNYVFITITSPNTDYNGTFKITRVSATEFYIDATWTVTRTGTWVGGLNTGNTVTDIDCGALNPEFVKDVVARRIEIIEGRKFIRITNSTGAYSYFGYSEPSFPLASGATAGFDLPSTFANIPAVAVDLASGDMEIAPSANTDIVITDATKVTALNVVTGTLTVIAGVTAAQLKAAVSSADGTTQTKAVKTAGDVAIPDGTALVSTNKLVVTAEDASTHASYTVTRAPSTNAKVTSGTYTVSTGGSGAQTIIGVPPAVAKATFLAALTKAESHSTWDSSDISAPNVLDGDTLVTLAEDAVTTITYTITVA